MQRGSRTAGLDRAGKPGRRVDGQHSKRSRWVAQQRRTAPCAVAKRQESDGRRGWTSVAPGKLLSPGEQDQRIFDKRIGKDRRQEAGTKLGCGCKPPAGSRQQLTCDAGLASPGYLLNASRSPLGLKTTQSSSLSGRLKGLGSKVDGCS